MPSGSAADDARSESDKAADKEAKKNPVVVTLASYIMGVYFRNRDYKQSNGTQDHLVDCWKMCLCEYSDVEKEKLRRIGITEDMFDPITDTKRRAALSQLQDIFNSPNDRPWSIRPTPVPQVVQSVADRATERIMKELASFIGMTGKIPSPRDAFMYAQNRMDEILREEMSFARTRSERMQNKIQDQFCEGGWIRAFNEMTQYLSVFGTAFIKGPIPRVEFKKKIVEDPKTGYAKAKFVSENVLTYSAVSPIDVYPSPDAVDVDDGDVCIRVRFSASDLWKFALTAKGGKRSGEVGEWIPAMVRMLLNRHPSGGVRLEDGTNDSTIRDLKGFGQTHQEDSCMMEGVEFFGNVKGTLLRDSGVIKTSEGKIIDGEDYYEVHTIVIDNVVVFCRIVNPFIGRPLSKAVFYEDVDSFWGQSIADKLVSCQRSINHSLKSLVMSMGYASSPVAYVQGVDRLIDKSPDALRMSPGKVFAFNTGILGANQVPVGTVNVETSLDKILATYQALIKKADDDSGIPAYTYGQNIVGGAGRTSSGLAMLTEAANRGMKMVINSVERDVVFKNVRMTFDYNMIYDPDPSIKGDCDIVASGVLSQILREQERSKIQSLFSLCTNNPLIAQIVGTKGITSLLRQVLKDFDLENIDDIVPSKERAEMLEAEEDLKRIQALAQNGQQGQGGQQEQSSGGGQQPQEQQEPPMLPGSPNNPQAAAARADSTNEPQRVAVGAPRERTVSERRGVA